MRSWLFVPGDRPGMMVKAAATEADIVILDLEDSVLERNKDRARIDVGEALVSLDRRGEVWVRVNPLNEPRCRDDLAVALEAGADGIVLPKAMSSHCIQRLLAHMEEIGRSQLPVMAIATENAASIFGLGTYAEVHNHLAGLAWGAEDLSADLSATASRDQSGQLTGPFSLARNMLLFGAAAADCQAIDGVWTNIRDLEGLEAECIAARRDGFCGKMAIHPAQVPIINRSFLPTVAEIEHANRIVEAFSLKDGSGAVNIDG